MPSLAKLAGFEQPEKTKVPDVLTAFKAAKKTSREPPPDLLSAFARAAKDTPPERQDDDSGREHAGPRDALVRIEGVADLLLGACSSLLLWSPGPRHLSEHAR
jgi:hypothetical protein